jgi:hypothetical protein
MHVKRAWPPSADRPCSPAATIAESPKKSGLDSEPLEESLGRVGFAFTFAAAAYNLVRLPKLLAEVG